MKLREYSKIHNITYKTAWNRFKAGKITGAELDETGHVIIKKDSDPHSDEESSKDEWTDL